MITVDYINDTLSCAEMTSSINIRNCTTVDPTNIKNETRCLELRNYSDEQFAKEIASEACITDKNSLIEKFTALRKSLEANFKFYNDLYPEINSEKVVSDYNTPGKEIAELNKKFLDIQPTINLINAKLANTFDVLEEFEGNLTVLTNCYIIKRQLMIIEPGFCFLMMPTMVSATLYIFLVNLFFLGASWGIFMTIKHAGDLGEKGKGLYIFCLLICSFFKL